MTAGRSDRWVKLHARILDSAVFTEMSPVRFKVFMACVLMANYEDKQWWDGKKYVTIPRGSFATSIVGLAARLGLSRQEMRSSIDSLCIAQNLTTVSQPGATRAYTIVTVTNYERYQGGTDDEQPQFQPQFQPQINHRSTTTIEAVEENTGRSSVQRESLADPAKMPVASRSKRPPVDPIRLEWFAEWWAVYPRKTKRDKALAAFLKHVTSRELCDQAISAVHRKLGGLDNPDPTYFRYPATWLNDKPWEDPDPPAQSTALTVASKNGSGHNATFAEQNERIRKEKFIARILKEQSRGTHQPK